MKLCLVRNRVRVVEEDRRQDRPVEPVDLVVFDKLQRVLSLTTHQRVFFFAGSFAFAAA